MLDAHFLSAIADLLVYLLTCLDVVDGAVDVTVLSGSM